MVASLNISALVFALALVTSLTWARPNSENLSEQDPAHQIHRIRRSQTATAINPDEDDAKFWVDKAQNLLTQKQGKQPITGKAKNVIMFLGDGMSIPTLAAARVYLGQSQGKTGEETVLSFEEFPHTGLSKTYCVDSQVADSACSATAYLGGVKGNTATTGVTGRVRLDDCAAMNNASNRVTSILQWSQDAGKATGIVTTTRITHASPSGTYAHIANRDWENDAQVRSSGQDPDVCDDIAEQLVLNSPGNNIKVILGGGRREFRPTDATDEDGNKGRRTDGVDLIESWQADKKERGVTFKYVSNRDQFQTVDPGTEFVLGLFNYDHMEYHLNSDKQKEPTLEEMTRFAIKSLQQDPKGFFLFVEGGRIDMAHHDTKANISLDETVEFAKAIQAAVDLTDEEDTLIVVTADHAHTLTFSGYPSRGNNILGISGTGSDRLPYSTIGYANGPGYKKPDSTGNRYDISKDKMDDKDYTFPATAPLSSETHGGDDVAVFARGPWSHFYAGTFEQNFIPHVMAFASCVGSGRTMCDDN